MAIERVYKAIDPVAFISDGENSGVINITDTFCFKVKMIVILNADGMVPARFQVKRVNSKTQMILGQVKTSLHNRSDLSAYLLSLNSTVSAPEQPRPDIPDVDYNRATYEEEPTVAHRRILVDKYGLPYTIDNPMPTQLSDGSIEIGTVNAEIEVQLSHQDNVPDVGDVADSTQIGDGVEILQINPDGSITVKLNPLPPSNVKVMSTFNEVSSVPSNTITTVATYTVPVAKIAILETVDVSGSNIGTYTVEVNGVVKDKKRTWFNGPMSERFDFRTTSGGSVQLVAGDVVRAVITHKRPTVGDFSAKIDVIEIE